MKARIQGEAHGYDDFQSALDDPLSSYDALFVEGREDDRLLGNLSTGYRLFLIGYIPLMRITSGEDLEAIAREAGVDYCDDIDADTHTIYHEMTPPLIRWLSFSVVVLLVILLFVWVITELLSSPHFTRIFGIFLVSLLAIVGIPMIFTSFLAAIAPGCLFGGLRDSYMAEQVNSVAKEKGHERVVVQCGQSHVTGIEEALEAKGWDVETQLSQSLFGRASRLAGIPFAILCRVIGIIVLRLPGAKPPYLRDSD